MPIGLLLFVAMAVAFQNCAPVFSELQSARTVGKNKVELTPSFTGVRQVENGESDGAQNEFGLQAAIGISNRVDLRARYELIFVGSSNGDATSVLAVGPKFSLWEKRIALSVPLGRALGAGTSNSWELQPTLLFTWPAIQDKLDITLAPKYLFTFCKECDDFFATNLGVAASSNLNKWAIRAEYGLLYDLGETGHFGQFSLGVSFTLGK